MNKLSYLMTLCIAVCCSNSELLAVKMRDPSKKQELSFEEGPKIRVLLAKDMCSALLEVKGPYRVVSTATGSVLSYGFTGKRFVIHGIKQGLRWGEEYPDDYQIAIIPENPSSTCFINGIQYRGTIIVTENSVDNKITIVNEVAIEDFLKSTLSIKISAPLAKEALAAFVISERTNAFYQSTKNDVQDALWDINAKEAKYFGQGVISTSKEIDRAIQATKFMVMKRHTHQEEIPFAVEWNKSKGNSFSPTNVNELAKKGMDAQAILKKYFPEAKIVSTLEPLPFFLR